MPVQALGAVFSADIVPDIGGLTGGQICELPTRHWILERKGSNPVCVSLVLLQLVVMVICPMSKMMMAPIMYMAALQEACFVRWLKSSSYERPNLLIGRHAHNVTEMAQMDQKNLWMD